MAFEYTYISTNRGGATYTHPNPVVLTCVTAEKVRDGFKFKRDVKAFDFVKYPPFILFLTSFSFIKCNGEW